MTAKALCLAALGTLVMSVPTFADTPFQDDWVMRMQAEKLQRQFVYRGSTLNKIAKITIDYYREDKADDKTVYEMLWFNDGKPIGMERKNDFKIPSGKVTKIVVKNKKDTSPEVEKAVADAILRLSLDAYKNRNAVVSIKIPEESFQGIVDAMNKLNCVETNVGADVLEKRKMNFPIETENEKDGPSVNLYYY